MAWKSRRRAEGLLAEPGADVGCAAAMILLYCVYRASRILLLTPSESVGVTRVHPSRMFITAVGPCGCLKTCIGSVSAHVVHRVEIHACTYQPNVAASTHRVPPSAVSESVAGEGTGLSSYCLKA
ncbi:hypothetical protein GY45DRAFT_199055 [Cubamyces sp. BRFM 1775]|nr:hypothetical protein GY45DRAFT_199055 [Cubamyces sp. BRFM 1775]